MNITLLKKIAKESIFNPNSKDLTYSKKILLDINNPYYWRIKAIECIKECEFNTQAVTDQNLRDAITLLILARAHYAETCNKKESQKNSQRRESTRKKVNPKTT